MSTRASGSAIYSGLQDEEDDIDATFTDNEAALNTSDDDDEEDEDSNMEEEEDVEDGDDDMDAITDLPTKDDEAAVSVLLAKMKARRIGSSSSPVAKDYSEDYDNMHVDVLCPLSELTKEEKTVISKARSINYYDPSSKKGFAKPIVKKIRRSTPSASSASGVKQKQKKPSAPIVPFTQGKDPKTAYLPHQTEAIVKLTGLLENGSGCLLAHAPGWGKTLTTLAILSFMQESDPTSSMTTIILYPLTLASVWRSEFVKWTFPNLEIWKSFDTKKQIDDFATFYQEPTNKLGVMRCILMTHDLFVHAIQSDFKAAVDTVNFLVIDEVHVFKNDSAKKHIAVINSRSSDFCGRIIGLTGTPVQNNVAELYGLLNLIQPNLFGTMTKKEVMKEWGANCKKSSLAEVCLQNGAMYERLTQIMHRQDASSGLHALLTNDDYAICFEAGFDKDMSIQPSKPALQAREEMLQASKDNRWHIIRYGIQACINLRAPLLVFSERKELLETLHKEYDNSRLLTGDTSNSMRAKMVYDFQSNVFDVFFLSTKAASMGITLTSATHVFICDACWNPTYETQAIARALRIGQTQNVTVYRFLAQSSIEIMIARDGPNKMGSAERIVDDKPISSVFSQEQLKEKNPQYIVDPNDKRYAVSEKADPILMHMALAKPEFKVFNYANLIQTVTRNNTEKEIWANEQLLVQTSFYNNSDLKSFDEDKPGEINNFKLDPPWRPFVYTESANTTKILCKVGPWRHKAVDYEIQVAFGDDKDFMKINPQWNGCDWQGYTGINHNSLSLVFEVNIDDFDTKYIAIRVRGEAWLSAFGRSIFTPWSEASVSFKKSFLA